jgi:hypothetical protein
MAWGTQQNVVRSAAAVPIDSANKVVMAASSRIAAVAPWHLD